MSDIKLATPMVKVVGRQVVDEGAMAEFLAEQGVRDWPSDGEAAGDVLVEAAGRVCYMSFSSPRPGGNDAYIRHVIEVGHGSVLEHCVYNVMVSGVSRSLTHELVRHRAGMSPSQLSQRYVDESDTAFVMPPALEKEVAAYLEWRQRLYAGRGEAISTEADIGGRWLAAMGACRSDYGRLVEYLTERDGAKFGSKTEARKAAREAARSVLPNATETKIFLTVNARAARHLIEMRCSRHADAEMRRLAGLLYEALLAESPAIFGDHEKVPLPDGSFEVVTKWRKV